MNFSKRIYAVVNRIPKGRVATYGQVAQIAGLGRQTRQVGYALSALREDYISTVTVLASGGLDSCALVGDLAHKRTVVPVFIRQGLKWEKVELYWLKRFLSSFRRKPESSGVKPLVVLDLPMADIYGNHWSTNGKVPGAKSPDSAVYLLGRNPALLVKVVIYSAMHKIPAIAIGSLDHNPFPDATPRFFRAYARALCMGLGRHVRIETPYRTMSKVEVIKRAKGLSLELSFSCLAPVGKKHCGRCNKCEERMKAFCAAQVTDRTQYASGPLARAKRGRGRG